MKRLLITGFDPFGGETINPSWEAVKALPDQIGQYRLTKLEIPTMFGKAFAQICAVADTLQPDVIVCIGQAGGRSAITPEVVGINLREATIADNAGCQPVGVPVVEDGPAAYFSTVPVREMVRAIRDAEIPAALSYAAGAFVCNDVLYSLLHRYHGTNTLVGFIHVPFLPAQAAAGVPSMAAQQITQALTLAITALQ